MLFPTTIQKEIIGIEMEIEHITDDLEKDSNITNFFWNVKDDGSLRDDGKEFVSIPLRVEVVPYAFHHLKTVFKEFFIKPSFSNRTSVHIHLNVLDMNIQEFLVFILLYFIYEKHYFSLAGTRRESNIFCVPLNESTQIDLILGNIKSITNINYTTYLEFLCYQWQKYNALNLACVYGNTVVNGYGTIEFRHLYGTLEPKILTEWIKSICYLKQFTKFFNLNNLLDFLKTACTTSEYVELYRNIFKDVALPINLKEVEKSITTLKLILEQYPQIPVNNLCLNHNNTLYNFISAKGNE